MSTRRFFIGIATVATTAVGLLGSWSGASAARSQWDNDGDGRIDTVAIDDDGNAIVEIYLVDRNNDGLIDEIDYDDSQNNRFDHYTFDDNFDGVYDRNIYDLNEDGIEDYSGGPFSSGLGLVTDAGGLAVLMDTDIGTPDSDGDGHIDSHDAYPVDPGAY